MEFINPANHTHNTTHHNATNHTTHHATHHTNHHTNTATNPTVLNFFDFRTYCRNKENKYYKCKERYAKEFCDLKYRDILERCEVSSGGVWKN